MKLYERPDNCVTIGRRRYRLRLTFDRVLQAMDAAADPLLTDADRLALMLGLMVRSRLPLRIRARTALLDKVLGLLDLEGKEHDGPPLMHLTQDAPLIRAAFQQAYGIDLTSCDLPWATFRDLLAGLPGDTRFGEIVAIRARPVPEPNKHNAREREQLLKAKAAVAIELTEEQRQQQYERSAGKMAASIFAWAERSGA